MPYTMWMTTINYRDTGVVANMEKVLLDHIPCYPIRPYMPKDRSIVTRIDIFGLPNWYGHSLPFQVKINAISEM